MNNNLYSNINGTLIPADQTNITSADNAVRSRYGVYETILFKDGVILLENLHWQRLFNGLVQLGFQIPEHYKTDFFEQKIKLLVAQNNLQHLCRVRLQVFTNSERSPWAPFFYIESIPVDEQVTSFNEKGLKVDILPGFQKEITAYSNCKLSDSKHYLLAQKVMYEAALDDVLLLNKKGNIIESAIANVFWIRDNIIYTPPLSEGCIAGTMRHWLLLALSNNGFDIREQEMKPIDLATADEIFLTNSIRQIRWVERVGPQVFGNEWSAKIYKQLF